MLYRYPKLSFKFYGTTEGSVAGGGGGSLVGAGSLVGGTFVGGTLVAVGGTSVAVNAA